MQLVLAGRSIYLPLSMRSQLGRLIWDLMAWEVHQEVCHQSRGLWRCCKWWFLKGIVWQREILWGNRALFVVGCHLQWGGCIPGLVKKKQCFLWTWVSSWSGSVKVRHSQKLFCTVLWRICRLLQCGSCLGRISLGWSVKSEFDCPMEVVPKVLLLQELELVCSALEDQ